MRRFGVGVLALTVWLETAIQTIAVEAVLGSCLTAGDDDI